MPDVRFHASITHRRGSKMKTTISAVMAGFLLTSSLIGGVLPAQRVYADNTSAVTSVAQENMSFQSLVSASAYESEQLLKALKEGSTDISSLTTIYQKLNRANDMLFYLDTTAESAGDIVAISNYMSASGEFIDSNNSIYKNILTIVDALVDAIKFKDVEETAWYYKDVNESVKLGLMNGDNGFFRPSDNLTVGQAMKLVAVIHAGYHNNMNRIPIPATTGHWAINYYSYVANYGVAPDWQFSIDELERTITRGEMAMLFANALPESEFKKINDFKNAPEQLNSADIKRLYEAGILIGDDSGFKASSYITRAETSAIVNRLKNAENRVKTYGKIEGIIPPSTPTSCPGSNVESCVVNNLWVNQKTYNPKTLYVSNPTFKNPQQISMVEFSGSNKINVLYNHTYNCATQEEYDAVIKAVTEAFLEVEKNYKPSDKISKFISKTLPESEMSKDYVQKILKALPNDFEGQCDLLVSSDKYKKVYNKIRTDYILREDKKRTNDVVDGLMLNSDKGEIDAYSILFTSNDYTCEATTALNMAIYDVMGYNSTAFGSGEANHMTVGIKCGSKWFTTLALNGLISLDETKGYLPDVVEDCYSTLGDIHSAGRVIVR